MGGCARNAGTTLPVLLGHAAASPRSWKISTGYVITGNSFYPGGVGNTQGNAANFASLIDDVEHKLFDRLPDETWFHRYRTGSVLSGMTTSASLSRNSRE